MRLASSIAAALFATSLPAQNSAIVAKPLAEIAVHPQREASAQTVALNESRISAEIAGRIEALPVQVGERVPRGALVARIDCRDHELAAARARAAVEATRSRLTLAEQQLERARGLQAKGFLSAEALSTRQTEMDVLRAETQEARAQHAAARRTVGKCVVRSPFAAIVRERLADVGELAAPGTALANLIDAEHLEVAAQVQVKDIGSLTAATPVVFEGDGGKRPLSLVRISPAIDAQARAVDVRLRFVQKPAAPGAAGRITWRDARSHLPAEIIVRRDGRLGVFVDDNGVARFRALPEAQEGRPAPAADFPRDAAIVVSGQLALQDGQRLR